MAAHPTDAREIDQRAPLARKAFTTLLVENRLPWRVEHWLSQRRMVQNFRRRRDARWERELFSTFVKPGNLVFDVGANVGNKAEIFLELGARVVGVEPDARNVAALETRFGAESRMTVVAAGVGAEPGQLQFHLSPHTERSTFALEQMQNLGDNCEWNKSDLVSVTTLDALIERFGVPDFCKIDVEGYEPQVLRGLTKALPALSFEFHGELFADVEPCVAYLEALGMTRFNVVLYPVGGHRRYHPLNRLYLPDLVTRSQLLDALNALRANKLAGDIYAFRG